MLATAGPLPPDDGSWAYEVKWDGIRALLFLPPDGGPLQVRSRNGNTHTGRYPELEPLAAQLAGAGGAVLDAEIVTLDERGRPDFARLQYRMHVTSPSDAARRRNTHPVQLAVFDLLWVNGSSLLGHTWDDRRALLATLPIHSGPWQVPACHHGNGEGLLAATQQAGLEGVVAKRRRSRYLPGVRSTDWVKIRHTETVEVVVAGWVPSTTTRSRPFGAVLLGAYDGDDLVYVGKAGSGFSEQALADMASRLAPLATSTSPFVNATREGLARYVQPVLVGEVNHSGWLGNELRLRFPVWRGLRPDRYPAEVTLASLKSAT